jgi:putative peptidoglycan lipid II flippase
VIGSTAGTWIAFASSLAAQVAITSRFGSTREAAAYVVVLGIAAAISGIAASTSRSVLTPRLVTRSGAIPRSAFTWMVRMAAVALGIAFVAVVAAEPLTSALAASVPDGYASRGLIGGATAFMLLQTLAGLMGTVALARGRLFAAAGSPALAPMSAAVWIVAAGAPSIESVMWALVVGSALQLAVLAATLGKVRVIDEPSPAIGLRLALTSAQFVLLSVIQPIERIFAGMKGPSGAVWYYVATRSLGSAEQLLVGGAAMGGLGSWSRLAQLQDAVALRRSVQRTLAWVGVAVGAASAVGVLWTPALVRLMYERGAFTERDSAAVTVLIYATLIGFGAESVSVVLSQLQLAHGMVDITIAIGVFHFCLRIGLAFLLATSLGSLGVAIAYSVSMAMILGVQLVLMTAQRLIHLGERTVWGSFAVGAALVLVATVLRVRG